MRNLFMGTKFGIDRIHVRIAGEVCVDVPQRLPFFAFNIGERALMCAYENTFEGSDGTYIARQNINQPNP